jgi:hypothetical protein
MYFKVHYRFRHSTQWYTVPFVTHDPRDFLECIRRDHGFEKIVFDDYYDTHHIRPNMWIVVRRVPRYWMPPPRPPPPPLPKEAEPSKESTPCEFGPDVYIPRKAMTPKTNPCRYIFVFRDFDDFEYVKI